MLFRSRAMHRHNRIHFYQLGGVLIASSTIVLALVPNLWGAVYYGIVNAIATPMYANPYTIIMMNAVQDYAEKENVLGRIIAKETYLTFGRCTGMILIVIFSKILPETVYLPVSVVICSMFPVVLVIYATFYHHHRDRLKSAGLV